MECQVLSQRAQGFAAVSVPGNCCRWLPEAAAITCCSRSHRGPVMQLFSHATTRARSSLLTCVVLMRCADQGRLAEAGQY